MTPLKRKYLLRSFLLSGLALVVMQLLVLDPFEREADFQLSDFYARTFDRHAQKRLSDDIVIVKVDKEGRDGIVKTAGLVTDAGASVTVMDIFMDREEECDTNRASLLEGCGGGLILPTTLSGREPSSLYSRVPSALDGYAELSTPVDKGETIRYYRSVTDGSASLAGTAAYTYRGGDILLDDKERLIDFSTAFFDEFTPEEVAEDPSCVAGRIALICNVKDFGDVHLTPLGPMPGAFIQAHIMDTILHDRAPHGCPSWIPLLIAFLLCALLFWPTLTLSFEMEKNDLAFFILRIVQLLLLLIIYCLGAILYVRYNFYIDLSICLLLLGSASLIAECVIGVRALRKYMKERKEGKPTPPEESARKNDKK
jgi:hypothetical protein